MIKRIYSEDFNIIIDFLKNNNSSPTHWPTWNLHVGNYYKTTFFYFAYYLKDKLVGICPVHKLKDGLLYNIFSGQFMFIPYGGWIFSQNNIKNLKLPLNFNESFYSSGIIKSFFFNNSNIINKNNSKTLLVDLSVDIEQIWTNQITSKRRNMIRKAQNSNLEIKMVDTLSKHIYVIYKNANIKYGIDSIPKTLLDSILEGSENIKFKIIYAKYDNDVQNVIILAYDKFYGIYWKGFSNDKPKVNGGGDLLQWEAIKFLKDNKCNYYDLCYIDKTNLPGIYKFKSGFSKNEKLVPILEQRSLIYKIINKLN